MTAAAVRKKLFFLKIISANPVAELISEKKILFKSFPETLLKSERNVFARPRFIQLFVCVASVVLGPYIRLICEVHSMNFIQ